MSRLPHTCGRTFRTDAGLAFHVTWCTGADVAPAPVVITAPETAPMARCGSVTPHGAHTISGARAWCAGNVNIVPAVDVAPETPAPVTPAPVNTAPPELDYTGHDYRPIASGGRRPCPACDTLTDEHGIGRYGGRALTPAEYAAALHALITAPETAPELAPAPVVAPAPETAPDGEYCAAHDLFACWHHGADAPAPELTPAPEPETAPETAPEGCDTCGRTGAAARVCAFARGCTCWRGVACDGLTQAARRAARKAETAPVSAPVTPAPARKAETMTAHAADDDDAGTGAAYVDVAPGVRVIVATGPADAYGAPSGARAIATWRNATPRLRRRPTVDIRPTLDTDAVSMRPVRGWSAPNAAPAEPTFACPNLPDDAHTGTMRRTSTARDDSTLYACDACDYRDTEYALARAASRASRPTVRATDAERAESRRRFATRRKSAPSAWRVTADPDADSMRPIVSTFAGRHWMTSGAATLAAAA